MLLNLDPAHTNPEIYYHLAFALYRLGEYQQAENSIVEITTNRTAKKHWLRLEMYCQIEREKWQSAERTALRILAMDPTAAGTWERLGSISVNQQDYARAAAYLEIATLLNPNSSHSQLTANLYGIQSAWNEQVRRQQSTDESPYRMARELAASCQYEQALATLQNAGTGSDMESALLMGELLFALGKNKEAVTSLLAVENAPCHGLSRTAQHSKNRKTKRQYQDRLRARASLLAGQVLWLDHKWERARDVFKELELLPGHGELGKSLALCMQTLLQEQRRQVVMPEIYESPL
jgi:tetratricopeptide (TPR) repeat protein